MRQRGDTAGARGGRCALGIPRPHVGPEKRQALPVCSDFSRNHGEAAGASLEHPHSQLIALPIVPRRVREEVDNCWHYYDEKERCIFCDIIRQNVIPASGSLVKTNISITLALTLRGSV